jgi:uncharacterized protein
MKSIITNSEEKKKFYIRLDGHEAFMKYEIKDGNIMDMHTTYVPDEFRGQDIASAIIKEALEFAASNNMKVIPTCPFVKAYIEQNKEYEKLLA